MRRFTPRMLLIMGGAAAVLVALLGLLIAYSGGGEEAGRSFPQIGDHFHAEYSIFLCGETVPPFPQTLGGLHTHGDGVIHIEPLRPVQAGRNATLVRFIANTGSRLTNDSLKFPSGVTYTNGEPCPDGQIGQLFLWVNGILMTDIASYVLRDQDTIELSFEAR